MLDDILDISNNRQVFEDLKKLFAEEQAVAFVGAGASAGMYPQWGQVIDGLADYAVDYGRAKPSDRDRWKADTTSTPQQLVNTILRRLDEAYYHNFLKSTFAPRRGSDGKPFTPVHAALLRLPFKGYVTTNYDPAFEFARPVLRPNCLTTGTPTWQDDDEVYRWLTGDVFDEPEACPILWLHGYWQRPASIVLNSGEYNAAYKRGLYRNTFNRLWLQDHLVFAGFGFNDPQFTFMAGEILQDIRNAAALPRHIAVLSLRPEADGKWPDEDTLRDRRENLEADYHVRPLFYRVKPLPDGGEDHSELLELLEGLLPPPSPAEPVTAPAVPITSPAGPAIAPAAFPTHWEHETSNDEKFSGRDDEQARLDRWVRDQAVRAIGVTAVGGTGKTALVGHWLKNTEGWRSRTFAGLFGWSFYQDRDSSAFLEGLLLWAHEVFGTPEPNDETDLVAAALTLMRDHPLVVVLDGLEVLQEGPEDARYGTFLDGTLREFLGALFAGRHESLAILTSRFVFADLERHLGTQFHQLELSGLPEDLGAALLADLDVRGPHHERMEVSRRLEGHPLALRVFAEAIPDGERDQPGGFLEEAFRTSALDPDAPVAGKLRRLLVFYEGKLPPNQTRLLSIVALFRSPEETILRLAAGLFADDEQEALPDDAALAEELGWLHRRGILTREPTQDGHGYACHPILRDHFRSLLLDEGADTARRAADLLQGAPSEEQPRSVQEIEPVLLAIELLLEAGEFQAGDELYTARLQDEFLFLSMPAFAEGLRCAMGFVANESRRQQCEEKLSRTRLSFYLNEVGLFASQSGHYELAATFYADSNAMYREMGVAGSLNIGLQNQADLSIFLGQLADSADSTAEATSLALELRDEAEIFIGYAYCGSVAALSAQVGAAARDFAIANALGKKNDADGAELYSGRGVRWAEMLLRTGHPALAARRTTANLRICEAEGWYQDVARCHQVLAACALAKGKPDEAEAQLRQSEPVFQRGQMLYDLARVHMTAGQVALARRDVTEGIRRSAEALALAQPRGMRLIHADALVLRGQARLLEAAPPVGRRARAGEPNDPVFRALDDAEEGLRIARDCGYAWAERDALFLQAETHTALSSAYRAADNEIAANRHRDSAHSIRQEAEALASRLILTEDDLAEADAKAAEWLEQWEKETAAKS